MPLFLRVVVLFLRVPVVFRLRVPVVFLLRVLVVFRLRVPVVFLFRVVALFLPVPVVFRLRPVAFLLRVLVVFLFRVPEVFFRDVVVAFRDARELLRPDDRPRVPGSWSAWSPSASRRSCSTGRERTLDIAWSVTSRPAGVTTCVTWEKSFGKA